MSARHTQLLGRCHSEQLLGDVAGTAVLDAHGDPQEAHTPRPQPRLSLACLSLAPRPTCEAAGKGLGRVLLSDGRARRHHLP